MSQIAEKKVRPRSAAIGRVNSSSFVPSPPKAATFPVAMHDSAFTTSRLAGGVYIDARLPHKVCLDALLPGGR
jgi:hypothetical protein